MFLTEAVEEIKARVYVQELFSFENGVCEIIWTNMVEPGRPQMTV